MGNNICVGCSSFLTFTAGAELIILRPLSCWEKAVATALVADLVLTKAALLVNIETELGKRIMVEGIVAAYLDILLKRMEKLNTRCFVEVVGWMKNESIVQYVVILIMVFGHCFVWW